MGTRADFYIDKSNKPQWIGSIAWDGYSIAEASGGNISPNDIKDRSQEFLEHQIKCCKDGGDYESLVNEYLKGRRDGTRKEHGWPWPWNNSKLTDETYLFKDGRVWRMFDHDGNYEDASTPCKFAPIESELHDENGDFIDQPESICVIVPNMKELKKVTMGDRSGVIVIQSN